MLVVMQRHAGAGDVQRVIEVVRDMGYEARPIPGRQRVAIGVIGNDGRLDPARLLCLPEVLEVIHVSQPYKQVSREWREDPTVVRLANGVEIGGEGVVVMAGPCAVESAEQILATAERVRAAGATVLRGGAFKPRSSPYAFQGLGEAGLELLALAREQTGLAIVTEALDAETLPAVAEVADIVQIGARNMQNYSLLKLAGRIEKPVLLKRGMSATIRDLLLSAEYVLSEGNPNVILCERGVRSFDTQTRNMLDLTAVPVVHALSHLPIIADPSHGTGLRSKVRPMARAAVAAGADGLLVEVHVRPDEALSDGAQSLDPEEFVRLMAEVEPIAAAVGRHVVRRDFQQRDFATPARAGTLAEGPTVTPAQALSGGTSRLPRGRAHQLKGRP
jgi:3-deoxy-7-phosphoheptulonate synthase